MTETLDVDISGEFDALIKANTPFEAGSLIDGQSPEDLQTDGWADVFQQEVASSEEVTEAEIVIPFGADIGRRVTELMIENGNPDPHITPIPPGGTKRTEYLSQFSNRPAETDVKNDDPA